MSEQHDKIDVSLNRDLVRALRAKRVERGLSCEELDDIAGIPDRYMNKLENYRSNNGRGIGLKSLELVLQAMGLKLMLVDPGAEERTARRVNGLRRRAR